jgi:hypothetical protein
MEAHDENARQGARDQQNAAVQIPPHVANLVSRGDYWLEIERLVTSAPFKLHVASLSRKSWEVIGMKHREAFIVNGRKKNGNWLSDSRPVR